MEDKLIKIHRVTKVVKGGRIFSYTSTSISGNKINIIGFGRGKSREILDSIKKSYLKARNNIVKIQLKNGKIPHFVYAKHCSSKLLIFPASKIIGLVASKFAKHVFVYSGVKSVYSKIHGSTNTINVVICVIKALSLLKI